MDERRQAEAKVPRTYEVRKYAPSTFIQKYSFMLIRPPRFTYNQEIINPKRKYKNRFDHTVYNVPFPLSVYTQPTTKYIVLYLHGNSSSRYEGYSQLPNLPAEVGLACFDFNGCGNRIEQEFISLGKKESKDVDIAVKFLKQRNFKVAVWGRSMGSVSALLSSQAKILVVDSPFSSLKLLCKQISQNQVPRCCLCFFHCFFSCFYWAVNKDVEKKTGVSLCQLDIIEQINTNCEEKSILFLAAKEDKMISFTHTEKLFQKFQGKKKKLLIFEGNHHSDRPFEILNEAYNFIEEVMFQNQVKVDTKKKEGGEIEGELGSFSILKEQKAEKLSGEMKLSAKIQMSSKFVEGGLTENLELMNQNESERR